jgi:S1-C subfamily serine protease
MRRRILISLIAVVLALGFLQFKQRYLDYKPAPVIQQREISLPDRIEQVSGSVVHIMNETQGKQGSGVAITKNIIMTARHVVEDSNDFTVTLADGEQIKSTQAVSSKKYDLGFIRVSEPVLKPTRLGSVKDCRLGQQVFVVGSPYGKLNFNTVTLGIVAGLNRNFDEWVTKRGYPKYGWSVTFSTDASALPGNSGCPVFTMDGRVRGIIVGGFVPALIYCIPVDLVVKDLSLISAMFALDNYEIEKADEWGGHGQSYHSGE